MGWCVMRQQGRTRLGIVAAVFPVVVAAGCATSGTPASGGAPASGSGSAKLPIGDSKAPMPSPDTCKVGWTKTVRPSSSVTRVMKVKSARSYSLGGVQGEYDHLVPLELGGAPDDPRNLWVEPGHIPNPKDAVEHKLNDAVCSGLVPLAKAQRAIAVRWVTAFDDTGLRVSGGKVCLRDNPSKCADSRHGGSRDGD